MKKTNEVEKLKKVLERHITFTTDKTMSEISKDGDLLLKALEQDIRIEEEIQKSQTEICRINQEIELLNEKPPVELVEFEPRLEPEAVYKKTRFSWRHLFGGNKVDWDWDTSDIAPWIFTILVSIMIGLFVAISNLLPSISSFKMEWAMAGLIFGGAVVGAGFLLFCVDFFILKIFLTIGYYVLYFTFSPIILIVNAFRYFKFKSAYANGEREYNAEIARIRQLNEKEKAENEINNEKLLLEAEQLWESNSQVRTDKNEELNKQLKEAEQNLIDAKNAAIEVKKVFCCPPNYDEINIKRTLRDYLKNYKANTLTDAINLYDRIQSEIEWRNEQKMKMNHILWRLDDISAYEKEKVLIEKKQMEENIKHNEFMRQKAEEESRRAAAIAKEQREALQEQKEQLEKIKEKISYSGYLSSSEIDDIAKKVVENM